LAKLDEIVTVNIDIAAPAIDESNFDNLLIVGPPPALTPSKPIRPIGRYSDLSEVTEAGFAAFGDNADPIGVAARIAFSQNPKPTHIYIAPMLDVPYTITGGTLKVISTVNALQEGIPVGEIDPSVPSTRDSLPWIQMAYSRAAVSLMECEIEKDGVAVWGKMLPLTEEPNAFIQVAIGTPSDPAADQMNIPAGEEAGTYTVTLTGTDADGNKTSITQSVTFDGVSEYTALNRFVSYIPTAAAVTDALDTANAMTGWYVLCEAGIDESLFETMADWTEAQIKQFAYTFLSEDDPVDAVYFRSQGWCGLINDTDLPADVPASNQYLHVGAVARCLSFPAGSETWAFKRLAALRPAEISSTLRKLLSDGHSNFFSQYAGRNITMNGQVRGGEWIDVIRGRDWLQNDMQLRIFSLMLMRSKIPYTNAGIALVENQMIASLKAATQRGIVAPDEWDEDGTLIPGFVVRVPNSQGLTATQRASRILEGCRFTARIAGAIHVVRVDGVLTYEGGADFGTDV
jgi:hypothetical protein